MYVEERLFDKDGVTGAKFNLSNNYANWREKQEIELTKPLEVVMLDYRGNKENEGK